MDRFAATKNHSERTDPVRLAIIPARGGSKRIPRKNIRPLAGLPAIAWPIRAALASEKFETVVVTTDDEEIAEVARQYGADVPFLRPKNLSGDFTGTRQVIRHAISELGAETGYTCCIYPTAVLVSPADLRDAVGAHEVAGVSVISVSALDRRLWRGFAAESGRLRRLFPEFAGTRSQDLPELFVDAGQFYVASNEHWLDTGLSLAEGAIPHALPIERAIDIDTEEDWQALECVFSKRVEGINLLSE